VIDDFTYATEVANADVSVCTLMKLLGHESMTISQRNVSVPGPKTVLRQPGTRSMSSSSSLPLTNDNLCGFCQFA
jgi:hypothetical protein